MRTKFIALLLLASCIGSAFAQANQTAKAEPAAEAIPAATAEQTTATAPVAAEPATQSTQAAAGTTTATGAPAAEDWYQNKPIRSIVFVGLKNVSKSELDGLFSSYQGKKFSDELYWDVLQKMYALDYFADISPIALPGDPEKKTVLLQFTVTEKPVVRSIKFTGNVALKSGELLPKVTIKEGDIYNEMKSKVDERALRDFYLEKGFANVKISSEAVVGKDRSISLVFTIVEGKKTVISSISFEGNKVMASKTLRKQMKLKENGFMVTGTFRESDLEADKQAIKSYYNGHGYVDANVESVIREVDTESSPDKNLLKLTFVIKEGEQYTYGGTTLEGNHLFTTEELLLKMRLKTGEIIDLNRFNEGFQGIADVYFENGYTSNYISKKEQRDNDTKRISYIVTIVESERSHIEHLIIKGNTKTKESVIIREFSIEPGDIFSKAKLISSIRNLYNLRYFSTVAPDVTQGSERNLVDVIVNVEEQSTASVQFGITFSGVTDADSFPLSAFVKWEEKNLMGTGQTVSVDVTASPDTQSLTLGYSQNWFLGSPLTVSFDLSVAHKYLYTYTDEEGVIFSDSYNKDNGSVPDPYSSLSEYQNASSIDDSYRMKYEQLSYSLGTSTGYRWQPLFATVTLRGGVTFSVAQNFYDANVFRPADVAVREKNGHWQWGNSIWTRLSLDRRDINYDPSTGWFASQQVTYYGLFPSVESDYFARFETKAEGYLTLIDHPITNAWNLKVVLAAFSGISFQMKTTPVVISDTNKLYIDGMFIGRGWTSLYDDSAARGDFMINHSVEARIPVVKGVIAFDYFFDAAAVKRQYSDMSTLSMNDYYFSYGPGLRFLIPQFPLRFLFANTFRMQNGNFEWRNGRSADWTFVLSFNIANL